MKRIFYLIVAFIMIQSCSTPTKIVSTPKEIPVESPVVSSELQMQSLKRKVAIARFSNETQYSKSLFYDKENDPVGKQATDILSAKLASTGKFILLERADYEQIISEVEKGDASFQKIGADYLIVGSISEFGRKTEGNVDLIGRKKTQKATATVNIRLIEVETGRIIYSEEASGEALTETKTVMGIGSSADYDSSLNDQAISAAISKLVDNVINNLLDKPWKSYILAKEEGVYIISGGKSQGIKVGDVFNVMERGKKVKNPQTNMMIELPGKKVGELRVDNLMGSNIDDEVAMATLVSGAIESTDFQNYFIEEQK